jgi:signal transduction histidine kinase
MMLVVALGTGIISEILRYEHFRRETNYAAVCKEAERRIHSMEKRILHLLKQLAEGIGNHGHLSDKEIDHLDQFLSDIQDFTLLVFNHDSLQYWSDNAVTVTYDEIIRAGDRSPLQTGNGLYEVIYLQKGSRTLAGLFLIRSQYVLENEYLVNDFNPLLQLPPRTNLSLVKSDKIYPVYSSSGRLLFSLSFIPYAEKRITEERITAAGILAFTSVLLLVVFFFLLTRWLLKQNAIAGLLLIMAVVGLRFLISYLKVPPAMYELPLFNPRYYASSYLLYSLGDLLINSLIICYLILSLYLYYDSRILSNTIGNKNLYSSLRIIIIWLFTFIFSVLVNYFLSSLILHSRISFNINNVFELTGFSLAGFFIIGVLMFSFYLVCDGGIRYAFSTGIRLPVLIIYFLISQGLFLLILINSRDSELFRHYGVDAFITANLIILGTALIRLRSQQAFSFTFSVAFIFLFSLFAAKSIFDLNKKRELQDRKALAVRLDNNQDAIAEYLYDELSGNIREDRFITGYFASSYSELLTMAQQGDVLQKRMLTRYFTGYWRKYDINIRAFKGESLPINTGGDPSWNAEYYENIIATRGQPTRVSGLYFINDQPGKVSYIGRIRVYAPEAPDSLLGMMFIELSSRYIRETSGYPDLLISSKVKVQRDISGYSHARYIDGVLINQFGTYSYPLQWDWLMDHLPATGTMHQVEIAGLSHLFYRPSVRHLIIVSKVPAGVLEMITLFSYILTFFILVFSALFILYKLYQQQFRPVLSFNLRIQISVMAVVILTMLTLGLSTVFYIIKDYSKTQSLRLKERVASLNQMVSRELAMLPSDQLLSEELNVRFYQIHNYTGIDFSLFNSHGINVFSTQPKLYDQQIIAPVMNMQVLRMFRQLQSSTYVSYENIGRLWFLNGYAALRNNENRVVGYLSLPYFARGSELKKEISTFLVALINIYVLLFALAVLITFIVSGHITRPLRIIQEKMSRVKLEKTNERILWKRKDEIGSLIDEYNRMIDQLAESAQQLARSERESAWREMARQVAHEIKNPLTPMKLHVQHLQRTWKEHPEQLEETINKFSRALIEQIDTLAGIASAFSSFARMPGEQFMAVNIPEIVKNSVNLYSESSTATIRIQDETSGQAEVYADKDQMLRVFSNLIKNAIQAIPDDRKGEIIIRINQDDHEVDISVSDNGTGISPDRVDKIFMPNFTTKTGGTGLGLAMVKSIIENSQGRIWFETREERGTTFFIRLPRYIPE